jgi:hypothetical protein
VIVSALHFQTSDIGLTASVANGSGCGDSSDRKFELWFRRRAPGVTYLLQAPSNEVKQTWLADLSCILWRQAIRNRERRRNEVAQTGRGTAPVIDLAPGTDSIHDRLVGMKLAGGGKRRAATCVVDLSPRTSRIWRAKYRQRRRSRDLAHWCRLMARVVSWST